MVTWQNDKTPGIIGTGVLYNLSNNERRNKLNALESVKKTSTLRRKNVKEGRNIIERGLLRNEGLPYMKPTTNLQRGVLPKYPNNYGDANMFRSLGRTNYMPNLNKNSNSNFLPTLGINLAGSYKRNTQMEEGRAGFNLGSSKRKTRKQRKSRR